MRAVTMTRSDSGFTQSPVDYNNNNSLYSSPEGMSFSAEEMMGFMDQEVCQSQPWAPQVDQGDVPRLVVPSSQYAIQQNSMPDWTDTCSSFGSQQMSEASPLLYTTPLSPNPPSLVTDLESAPSMSRDTSRTSNYSGEIGGAVQMMGMDSGRSNYAYVPEPAVNPYYSYPQQTSQLGLAIDNSIMHTPREHQSQQYLAPPVGIHGYSQAQQGDSIVNQAGKRVMRLEKQQVKHRHSSSSPSVSSSASSPRRSSTSSSANKYHCTQCSEWSQGFRGEHELTRHMKLRHSDRRSVWMCIAPPENPGYLDGCKNCDAGKLYGAYYNGAQHIRRCHFSPTRRGRKPKAESNAAKVNKAASVRDGERERNFPDMKTMKRYLVEVFVDREDNIVDETGLSQEVIDKVKRNKAASSKHAIKEEQFDEQYDMEVEDSINFDDVDAEGDEVSDEGTASFDAHHEYHHGQYSQQYHIPSQINNFPNLSQAQLLQDLTIDGYPVPVDRSTSFDFDFVSLQ